MKNLWLRKPKGLTVVLFVVCLTAASPFLVLGYLFIWAHVLLREVPHEGRAILHGILQERRAIAPEWRDAQPYRPGTMVAFREFINAAQEVSNAVKASFAGTTVTVESPPCNCAAEQEFIDSTNFASLYSCGTVDDIVASSSTLWLNCHRREVEILDRLAAMPDFTSDIVAYPLDSEDAEAAAEISGIFAFHQVAWLMAECLADMDVATSHAIGLYSRLNQSINRSRYYTPHCDKTLEAITLLVWKKRDREMAAKVLGFLERELPSRDRWSHRTLEQKISSWALDYQLVHVRELVKAGAKFDFRRKYTGLELIREYQIARDNFRTQAGLKAQRNWGMGEYPTENRFLHFFCVRKLSAWTAFAQEIDFLQQQDWSIGHQFPVGTIGAKVSKKLPPTLHTAYDLARLNIAALIYNLDGGSWPRSTQDLVPKYLPVNPPDPLPDNPFVWSVELNRFTLQKPLRNIGII